MPLPNGNPRVATALMEGPISGPTRDICSVKHYAKCRDRTDRQASEIWQNGVRIWFTLWGGEAAAALANGFRIDSKLTPLRLVNIEGDAQT
jgi:hypothetical protein